VEGGSETADLFQAAPIQVKIRRGRRRQARKGMVGKNKGEDATEKGTNKRGQFNSDFLKFLFWTGQLSNLDGGQREMKRGGGGLLRMK